MMFDFNGKKYEKASTHQKEWGEKLINELDLKGDEWMIDLGYGDGAIAAQLADLVSNGRVLGIDASQSMIETTRNHQRDNLSFMMKDSNSLNFEKGFDIIFSNATLHWIKDHDRLLRNTHACLKRNGVLRFNFAADGNCSHFIKVIKIAMGLPQFSQYFTDFEWPWFMPKEEEYEAFVRQFPFHEIRVWGENADRYFPNSDMRVKWIDQPSLVPFIKWVGQVDKKPFREFVVESMIEETLQEDGTCFETFRQVNVFARK